MENGGILVQQQEQEQQQQRREKEQQQQQQQQQLLQDNHSHVSSELKQKQKQQNNKDDNDNDDEEEEEEEEEEVEERYIPKLFSRRIIPEHILLKVLRKCTKRQWTVLGLLSAASLFAKYDIVVFALAISQIQSSLSIADSEVSYITTMVRLGALPALLLSVAGDRYGRKRILLYTLIPYTLFTAATALSVSMYMFVALQFLSRMFIIAELTISMVTVIEEFDATNRGWVVGMLGAVSALGAGVAIIFYGFLGGYSFGWRIMYILGLVPLSIISYFRRFLPETARFQRMTARYENNNKSNNNCSKNNNINSNNNNNDNINNNSGIAISQQSSESSASSSSSLSSSSSSSPVSASITNSSSSSSSPSIESHAHHHGSKSFFAPVRLLFASYPSRFIFASAFTFAVFFCASVGSFYNFKYMEEEHHFTPGDVSLLGIFGGAAAVVMYIVSGRLSDLHGRRLLCMIFTFFYFVSLLMFFNVMNTVLVVLFWILFMSFEFGMETVSSALYIELFPTSHRSTAAGMQSVFTVLGQVSGSLTESIIYNSSGPHPSHWRAITLIALPGLILPCLLIPLPETNSRDLDVLSPERM